MWQNLFGTIHFDYLKENLLPTNNGNELLTIT